MRWPLNQISISNGYSATHTANDLRGTVGDTIYAPDSGEVIGVNDIASGYFGGKYIVLQGDSGYRFYMGHNDSNSVRLGQRVKEGEIIGKVGQTGFAVPSKGISAPSGPHIHFEMSRGGKTYDPSKVIPKSKPTKKEKEVITRGRAIRLLRLTRRGVSEKKIAELMKWDEDKWLDSVYKSSWFAEQSSRIKGAAGATLDKIKALLGIK